MPPDEPAEVPPEGPSVDPWDGVCGVVPAGGRGTRLGQDKPAVLVSGRSLLEHLLAGLPERVPVAVVGPPRSLPATRRSVLACREEPPGGGPAAAVAAGVSALAEAGLLAEVVLVLPADAPRAAAAVPALLAALRGAPASSAAVAVDGGGRRQVLVVAHRARALVERVHALRGPTGLAGAPAARLLPAPPALVEVPVADPVLADVDTPDDLARERGQLVGEVRGVVDGRSRGPAS